MQAPAWRCSLTPLLCHAGASLASFFAEAGATYSLGASGAVFGLFAVAVLLKLRFNFKKLVECVVLGQFVVKQVLQVLYPPSHTEQCACLCHGAKL